MLFRSWFYKFSETNKKGEKIIIELSKCNNSGGNHALPILWFKNGFIDRVLETYWGIEVDCTDTEGRCWERYNPQHKISNDGKRTVINFDWMFEATEQNKALLINEVYRLFSSAIGETATEEKHRKVREYAKEHNIEVLTKKPEGWINLNYCTAPIGSTYIGNVKPNIHNLKDKDRKEALLLI